MNDDDDDDDSDDDDDDYDDDDNVEFSIVDFHFVFDFVGEFWHRGIAEAEAENMK